MLPVFFTDYDRRFAPRLLRLADGTDASCRGAFPTGTALRLLLLLPRRLGVSRPFLRLWRDGTGQTDLPFSLRSVSAARDVYELPLDTGALCAGEESGLFYCFLYLHRGGQNLFSDTGNQVDFSLSDTPKRPFRFLFYAPSFSVPAWFPGSVVYHIFIDRFCRGKGAAVPPPQGYSAWDDPVLPYVEDETGRVRSQFFGGNLWGVAEKLDYLAGLGVTVLYLSPLFASSSNHKYDTGDYEQVDGGFGGEAALLHLLEAARARGIRLILDGVFNHAGADSRYFNRYGSYPAPGAYQSPASPYRDWFTFDPALPAGYECWWGIPSLPRLRCENPAVRDYLAGREGVAATWVRKGVSGWRLDVADELPDGFLTALRRNLPTQREQPLLLGEVWENAADKIAYGVRRRYFLGRQLDGVMNYPLRTALLAFLTNGEGPALCDVLTELYASYPPPVCACLYNALGTHDTPRILTLLCGGEPSDPAVRTRGVALLRMGLTLLYTVYGVPALFYGDETGLPGGGDPDCRRPFPWGREDESLLAFVRALGALRRAFSVPLRGEFRLLGRGERHVFYLRSGSHSPRRPFPTGSLAVLANRSDAPLSFSLPGVWRPVLSSASASAPADDTPSGSLLSAPACTAAVWVKVNAERKKSGCSDTRRLFSDGKA